MEKLELKYMKGYLGTGLKMLSNNNFVSPLIRELTVDGFEFTINQRKPILHPLSDLTKEIEVNGEKFVPILKVCDLLGFHYTKYSFSQHSVDLVLSTKYHRENTKTKEPQKIRFWFSNFQGISFYCTSMNKLMYKDLYGAIQKLYEWHFDIHNLIEKSLAIDINTLNK